MKSAVIVFPGSNCDRDMMVALEAATGRAPVAVWHRETCLPDDLDLVALPGGFSYGDYLRSGAIAGRSPVMADVKARADRGLRVLGVCNGFQVLCEAGLLPGALMRNTGIHFVCRDVHLRVENARTAFTNAHTQGQVIRGHVAHHDGNYFCDDDTLTALEDQGRVAFRYCAADGAVTAEANPNGSRNNIAGVLNAAGNVLGMMPHPERLIAPELGGTDGRGVFDSLVAALADA
ncbi:phosphoribosylformylglycinamidine synthase I [Rhodothalassium salexigens]|uniref:phosphoribosylformylglycinamidine synthase subunit PurQ n=1 Tax=Rhodothalassium salexigens TaxID=1086 RepID=UPI00191463C1|nr:phosphoribosylformylglycinamidine synthase subunit PurQ [Rhodothalassium salexigens]MBK5910743.1 phosphoribosylformylglycinamidine synthase I [Rhodothalassium salexigens]MBK5919807.1 phosphoribosylformylglycinamidine synthase I [Rhodothalassium salexigens]